MSDLKALAGALVEQVEAFRAADDCLTQSEQVRRQWADAESGPDRTRGLELTEALLAVAKAHLTVAAVHHRYVVSMLDVIKAQPKGEGE